MKHWIEAARLRTLPLSVSGIIVGSMYALANPTENILTPTEVFNWRLFPGFTDRQTLAASGFPSNSLTLIIAAPIHQELTVCRLARSSSTPIPDRMTLSPSF